MPIPAVVELKSAFHWFCETCGRPNFALPNKMEFAPGEKALVFRDIHAWDEEEPLPDGWDEFEMMQMPSTVTCGVCGASFGTMPEQSPDGFCECEEDDQ